MRAGALWVPGFYLAREGTALVRHILAVDVLLLYHIGILIMTLFSKMESGLSYFEWFSFGVSLVFTLIMLRFRIRSGMQQELFSSQALKNPSAEDSPAR